MTTKNPRNQPPTVEPSAAVRRAIAEAKELPLLDVGPLLAGQPGALEQLAADVKLIQENLGFFAIVNHGIPASLIERSFEQVAQLGEAFWPGVFEEAKRSPAPPPDVFDRLGCALRQGPALLAVASPAQPAPMTATCLFSSILGRINAMAYFYGRSLK